jgi:HK97 family phage major capsid protein
MELELQIKAAVDNVAEIKSKLNKFGEEAAEGKRAIAALEAKLAAVDNEAKLNEFKSEMQKQFDDLATKTKKPAPALAADFKSAYQETFDNGNFANQLKSGQPFKMEVKAVADMTMSNNLLPDGANSAIPTIQQGVVLKPGQARSFTDLVQTVGSSTGLYWIYKETGSEGSISAKTEGANASQIDYDITKTVNNVATISGVTAISEEFLQDVDFVRGVLPQMLLRDFKKVQNATFSAALVAAISASAGTATVDVEQLIDAIAELEGTDYMPNGIVAKPANFARFYKTKDANGLYTLPSVMTSTPQGGLQLEGIDLYKANWSGIATNQAIVGDWSYAKVVQAAPITIKFYENDYELAKKGLVGVKISSRQSLALDDANAFLKVALGIA